MPPRGTFPALLAILTVASALLIGCSKPADVNEQAEAVTPQEELPVTAAKTDLIPREILFGNPDKAAARISPDGTQLAFLAPVDGVLNVWVAPLDKPAEARAVTDDKKRGIRMYFWAYTSQHILYLQDSDGDENWHVYAVDLESGETKDLTPLDKVAARIEEVSHRFPDTILIALNNRVEQLHDIYRVNIKTGERELIEENPGFVGYMTDEDYQVRFATQFAEDGSHVYLRPADNEMGWEPWLTIPHEDTMNTSPIGFNKAGDVLYMIDSRNRNAGALTSLDLETGEQKVIAENEKSDVADVMLHPTENTIEAVAFNYERKEWQILDEAVKKDIEYLRTVADGDLEITSRSLDNQHWIAAFLMDNGPVRYYHYDRAAKQANFLFTNRKDLQGLPLVHMHPVVIESRDGMNLVSYLSLPKGTDPDGDARPGRPLPMILLVHGGPWARDSWGYDPQHQWLANRGYAVLSVNFRGSTGFGKDFINAGNKEWAGKMHDDLLDAVDWAVKQKIAQEDKVAVMGGSYGGYATLVALTFTPEKFACGVDIVGPSSLVTLLNTIPEYWKPALQLFKTRVGDHQTEEGREFLESRSPLSFVEKIERPLLIGQGANDPRVKQSESDQIVKVMQEKKIPVSYVLFPDEGHGFARPENRMAFFAVAEAFLSEQLGGRFEEIGDAFDGSTIEVPAGQNEVPGLEAKLGMDK